MAKLLFPFGSKSYRRRLRSAARGRIETPQQSTHFKALRRGIGFLATVAVLTLPMAVATSCGQSTRDFSSAWIEPTAGQGSRRDLAPSISAGVDAPSSR